MSVGIEGINNLIMVIILFLALLLLCWVVYKSIDWFEKI